MHLSRIFATKIFAGFAKIRALLHIVDHRTNPLHPLLCAVRTRISGWSAGHRLVKLVPGFRACGARGRWDAGYEQQLWGVQGAPGEEPVTQKFTSTLKPHRKSARLIY